MVDYSVPSLTKRALRSNLHVSGGLTAPTCRPDGFADYQDARDFDAELCEQLEVSPQFVVRERCGFASAEAQSYEADDFLAAAVAREGGRGGTVTDPIAFGCSLRKNQVMEQIV